MKMIAAASANDTGIFELLTASLTLILVGLAVIWIFTFIIAHWKIFKKAGEPGWKCLIPIYNVYTYFKIAWSPLIFWIELVLILVRLIFTTFSGFLPKLIGKLASGAMSIPLIVIGIAAIALPLLTIFKLGKAFDKNIPFLLGLLFMYPIFSIILAFDYSDYVGTDSSESDDD